MGIRCSFISIFILIVVINVGIACAQSAPLQRNVVPVGSESGAPEAPGPYFALVIGINDYNHLTKLNTAVNDADSVGKVLREQYGFETTVLRNPSRHDILLALDNYRRTVADNANLLIYYGGHGYYDREMDKAYWAPVDAEKETYADWIIADEITSRARAIPARHILIVSDSCYSGMIAGTREDSPNMAPATLSVFLDKMLRKRSRGIISSGGNEPVTDEGAPGHSLFAHVLLQGLAQIEKEVFTADELFQGYVKAQVVGKSDQVPQYTIIRNSGDDFGDFVFFRLPSSTKLQPAGRGGTAVQPRDVLGQAKTLIATKAYASAYPLFKQAAEQGNPEAMAYLGFYYDSHKRKYAGSVGKDDVLATSWYRKAADAGNPWGMLNLGFMYAFGAGGLSKDEVQAVAWFRKAAEAGDARGSAFLGYMYEVGGGGLPKDDVQAAAWYRKAAETGVTRGMYSVGNMYREGRGGLAKDEVQAVAWFRKAAEDGDARGSAFLGYMYEVGGGGLAKDDVQALAWFRNAADAGDTWAMNSIGEMYREGRGGLPKDDVRAVAWYRKAAEAGDAGGMSNLGFMYAHGRGDLPKDELQALAWYRKGADLGDANSMNNLAWLLATSTDPRVRNPKEAVALAQRAVEIEADNANFLDTLATAYFEAGHRDKAAEAERRAVKLKPDNLSFRRALEKFEAANQQSETR